MSLLASHRELLVANSDQFAESCVLISHAGTEYSVDSRGLPLAGVFCLVAKSPDLGIDPDAVVARSSVFFPDSILPVPVRAYALPNQFWYIRKGAQLYKAEAVWPDDTLQAVVLYLTECDPADVGGD